MFCIDNKVAWIKFCIDKQMQNKTSVQIQMMPFDFNRKFMTMSESRKNKFSSDRMQVCKQFWK